MTKNTAPDNGGCDNAYLDNALGPEVQRAEDDGLVVAVNDQTESDTLAGSEKDPTKATFALYRRAMAIKLLHDARRSIARSRVSIRSWFQQQG